MLQLRKTGAAVFFAQGHKPGNLESGGGKPSQEPAHFGNRLVTSDDNRAKTLVFGEEDAGKRIREPPVQQYEQRPDGNEVLPEKNTGDSSVFGYEDDCEKQ